MSPLTQIRDFEGLHLLTTSRRRPPALCRVNLSNVFESSPCLSMCRIRRYSRPPSFLGCFFTIPIIKDSLIKCNSFLSFFTTFFQRFKTPVFLRLPPVSVYPFSGLYLLIFTHGGAFLLYKGKHPQFFTDKQTAPNFSPTFSMVLQNFFFLSVSFKSSNIRSIYGGVGCRHFIQ